MFLLDVEEELRESGCKCDTQEGDEHLRQLGVLTDLGEVLVLCETVQDQFLEKMHNAAEEVKPFSLLILSHPTKNTGF